MLLFIISELIMSDNNPKLSDSSDGLNNSLINTIGENDPFSESPIIMGPKDDNLGDDIPTLPIKVPKLLIDARGKHYVFTQLFYCVI